MNMMSKMIALLFVLKAFCIVDANAQTFQEQVDLSPFDSVAVQTEGRLKSFGSFAHGEMGFVSGPRKINGQSPEFTFLDMLFRPEAYEDADVIYVKAPIVRKPIADALVLVDPSLAERMDGFIKSGLISEALLKRPEVQPVMQQMQSDLLRTAKAMDSVRGARTVMRPDFLLRELRVIPSPSDKKDQQWSSMREIMLLAADPGALKASGTTATPIAGIDETKQRECAAAWKSLVEGWTNGDAVVVNKSLASIAAILPSINPGAYPDANRLRWESWYFSNGNLVWIWLVYALSVTLLLLGLVYQWRGARVAGIAVFVIAFALHSCALGLRWWISSRWPNSNMFEAVTTSAWFGGCAAVILEIFMRRRAAAGMFALASGFSSAVALMAAHFLPIQLNAQISNMMPVLHDVWLYIHTNVIIFSYCLIFMAAVSAGMYLIYRVFGGKAVYARVSSSTVGAIVGGGGTPVAGGVGTSGSGALRGEKLGEVLDGVTMLLMKLSFVLLWTGIAMGAIWADHSWGRPWGWDPKEVFALNTFVVFAILVHVRYRSKDKGLWTAILAVVGAAVMLFNWIVINFIITGLHSYA